MFGQNKSDRPEAAEITMQTLQFPGKASRSQSCFLPYHDVSPYFIILAFLECVDYFFLAGIFYLEKDNPRKQLFVTTNIEVAISNVQLS